MGTDFGEIFTNMLPALESKRNEFHFYGYTEVTTEDIWVYCLRKIWRNKDIEQIPVHKIANDILHISAAAFMTYTQIETQRDANWFSDLNSDELQMLLNPQNDNE